MTTYYWRVCTPRARAPTDHWFWVEPWVDPWVRIDDWVESTLDELEAEGFESPFVFVPRFAAGYLELEPN